MQVEIGKKYITRKGEIVGPMEKGADSTIITFSGKSWWADGLKITGHQSPNDIVAEYGVNDLVNHPPHYTKHPSGVECIQVTEHMNFNLGNAVKYIWRCDDKGDPVENLRKAEFYIKREIERRSK